MDFEHRGGYELQSVLDYVLEALLSLLEFDGVLENLKKCDFRVFTGLASFEIFWMVKSIGASCMRSSSLRLTVFERSYIEN